MRRQAMPVLALAVVALVLPVTLAVESEAGACSADDPASISADGSCGCGNLNRESGDVDAAELAAAREAATLGGDEAALSEAARRQNEEMVEIPPGNFAMGESKDRVWFSQDGEGPLRRARMSGFRMDTYEASNAKFRDFVEATGYVTEVEKFGDSFVAEIYLSEAVNQAIDTKVDAVPWWLPVQNASWRKPEGSDSGLDEASGSRYGKRWNHPVVHLTWHDADAYCRWRNASLPTEAQWEYAAHGGLERVMYPWGDDMYGADDPHNSTKKHRMNIWQGTFPTNNTAKDKFIKTAPVKAYGQQNQWGLYNMVGNVWEWVSDWWTPLHFLTEETQKTGLIDPTGPTLEELEYLAELGHMQKDASGSFEKIKKGGSFMCHKSYCWRYRICARSKMTADSSAHHVGVRCARPSADPVAAHWQSAPENQFEYTPPQGVEV